MINFLAAPPTPLPAPTLAPLPSPAPARNSHLLILFQNLT